MSADMREALERYGRHLRECPAITTLGGLLSSGTCTCGFGAALAAAPSDTPEDAFVYTEEPGPKAGALCFDPTHKGAPEGQPPAQGFLETGAVLDLLAVEKARRHVCYDDCLDPCPLDAAGAPEGLREALREARHHLTAPNQAGAQGRINALATIDAALASASRNHCQCGANWGCPICGFGAGTHPCRCDRERMDA